MMFRTCRASGGEAWDGVEVLDTGDTAWMLASAALVLLMTPGLALFYGGMVRSKSVLNMMMMSFSRSAWSASCGCCTATRIAFGNDVGGAGCSADPTSTPG